MKVLDPGHEYLLTSFDGVKPMWLRFVKRNDPPEKYPGNSDAYPGTQTQEVLRALIDRAHYVQGQQPDDDTNPQVISLLRQALVLLETRHATRHGVFASFSGAIETEPFCVTCGHILCFCGMAA